MQRVSGHQADQLATTTATAKTSNERRGHLQSATLKQQNVTIRRTLNKHSYLIKELALLLAFNLIVVSVSVTSCTLDEPKLIEQSLVNLNDILTHQQALISDCQQLERQKLNELKQVLQFEQTHPGLDPSLADRLTVKLPAVCLYLLGPPTLEPNETNDDTGSNGQPTRRAAGRQLAHRLDMVNWIYERDELAKLRDTKPKPKPISSPNSNRTKRDTLDSAAPVASKGALNDYWLDLNRLERDDNASDAGTAQQQEEWGKFHKQVNEMIGGEQFQLAIKQERERISGYLSPVILVPGLSGSRLQARVQANKRKVNIICSKQTGWQDVWLTLRWFLPVAIDCWIDNIRLEFDPIGGFVREPAGVETRVADFGSVESVRYLDLKSPQLTEYYSDIIDHYEQLGYEANKNLFAAPYDFRLAPQQLNDTFFVQLANLIEFAYSNTRHADTQDGPQADGQVTRLAGAGGGGGGGGAKKKVTLVCHSMGCTHLLLFLRHQSAAWRQAKIRKLIALSSPWGGAIKAVKALLVGDQFSLPIVSELKMRKLVRSFPSVAYLLPQAQVFERPDQNQADFGAQVMVQTPERTYTVGQLEALLRDTNMSLQWDWFSKTATQIEPLNPLPDLNVDCLHSLNIPTIETVIFRNVTDFPDGDYELVEGDGDGTVNRKSLLVCGAWAAKLPDRVKHKIIMNTSHSGILKSKQLLEHITDDVLSAKN